MGNKNAESMRYLIDPATASMLRKPDKITVIYRGKK